MARMQLLDGAFEFGRQRQARRIWPACSFWMVPLSSGDSAITFWRSSGLYVFIICCISAGMGAAPWGDSAATSPDEARLAASIRGVNRIFFMRSPGL